MELGCCKSCIKRHRHFQPRFLRRRNAGHLGQTGLNRFSWSSPFVVGQCAEARAGSVSRAVTVRGTGNTVFGAGSPLTARRALPSRSAEADRHEKGRQEMKVVQQDKMDELAKAGCKLYREDWRQKRLCALICYQADKLITRYCGTRCETHHHAHAESIAFRGFGDSPL